MFLSLKLPNCGLFIYCALVGLEGQKARIGLLQAMETLRAPPILPSTRLGTTIVYLYICFVFGLMLVLWGLWFPAYCALL